jgi:AAHS family 4-hydroxybenzoate transporter-like MFS transporter
LLLAEWGWRMIFVLGGIFPLALLPVLVFWLPESPRFLAAGQNLSPRNAALLRRLDITSARDDTVDVARSNPIWMLFGRGYALQTMLLWVIFLLQPFEPLLVRLLDADGTESDRH